MKYIKKMIVVPYIQATIENPHERYVVDLDNEMSQLLTKRDASIDDKIKLYAQTLIKFKQKFDPAAFSTNQAINNLSTQLSEIVNSVKPKTNEQPFNEIKQEPLEQLKNESPSTPKNKGKSKKKKSHISEISSYSESEINETMDKSYNMDALDTDDSRNISGMENFLTAKPDNNINLRNRTIINNLETPRNTNMNILSNAPKTARHKKPITDQDKFTLPPPQLKSIKETIPFSALEEKIENGISNNNKVVITKPKVSNSTKRLTQTGHGFNISNWISL